MNASELAIEDNVSALSQFAVMSQQRGMVPIVEPEVMVAEGTHSTSSYNTPSILCETTLPTERAHTEHGTRIRSIHEEWN